jgi:hypothetical protein
MTTTIHNQERIEQRLSFGASMEVKVETTRGNYTTVGTTIINNLQVGQIKQTLSKIDNTDFGKKDYAIKITQFALNNNTVKFNSEESKALAQGKQMVVSVVNSKGESNGNEVYAIVRNNTIVTTCFVKSYTGFNNLEAKLRVDGLIKKLKNFKKR